VGIIGYGGIGRELSRLLQPFNVEIIGVREKPIPSEETDAVWPMERLDELLASADHIVLCLPAIEEYRNLLDERRIGLIKPQARVYNIARGNLIDQEALLQALRERRIAGAALDVFEYEPLQPDSVVWDTPNLIVTPHIAGHDRGLRLRCLHRFIESFATYRL
jgi:phosphoglycerate dehydrogenase-like enzyme